MMNALAALIVWGTVIFLLAAFWQVVIPAAILWWAFSTYCKDEK